VAAQIKRASFFEGLANKKKIKKSEFFTCQIKTLFAPLQPATTKGIAVVN